MHMYARACMRLCVLVNACIFVTAIEEAHAQVLQGYYMSDYLSMNTSE